MRIIVVGGGMAGVSIAYELAASADVVLLEQESRLAQHTTGRSAAMYLQSYGNPLVRAITVRSRDAFDQLRRDFETPPLLTPFPLLWTSDEEKEAELRELLASDRPLRAVEPREAVLMCSVLRTARLAGAALDTSAMAIDVMAMHGAYVAGLRARGGEIRTSAQLVSLERRGDVWRASTPAGDVEADAIVNASGAWADEVARLAGVTPIGIEPRRRTIFTSLPAQPVPADGWPFIADVADRFYFKAEHGQVLVSPADETPDVPRDVKPEEIDIAHAIDVVNRFTTLGLRSVRSSWAGLRSFVADRSPVTGQRAAEPGFFWFAGQGGYGIQMAPALARAGASLLLEGRLPADIAEAGVTPEMLAPSRLD